MRRSEPPSKNPASRFPDAAAIQTPRNMIEQIARLNNVLIHRMEESNESGKSIGITWAKFEFAR